MAAAQLRPCWADWGSASSCISPRYSFHRKLSHGSLINIAETLPHLWCSAQLQMLPFLKVLCVYFIRNVLYSNTSSAFCLTGLCQRAIKEPLCTLEAAIPLPYSVLSWSATLSELFSSYSIRDCFPGQKREGKKRKRWKKRIPSLGHYVPNFYSE